jgi:FAD/FMN-containing dehydrogenase/Fe-S oxidoreductase
MSTKPDVIDFPMLQNLTPLEHERFSAHRELESLLRSTVRGEVRFDLGSRALYATDASNYRQLPIGVVIPRDAADVEAALAACRATSAAVLPRGGGTSLSGQCTNVAVVFDYSKYVNRLDSLDPEARLTTVQPGIVLDRVREAAELHHLTYAPDPATHSRCTIGGMIGNNSCGVHGLLGGKTVDNVESLDIVLYDGTRMTVGRTSPEQLEASIRTGGRTGQIYAGLKRLADQYGDLVRKKYPRIPRRVSGYNLDELLPENGFHVARALVGSEGTCVNILSARLNLIASPPCRVLTVLGFADAFAAADAVPLALEHGPIGLEGFDHLLVQYMRRKGLALSELDTLPPGVGYLLVEMGAWSAEEARAKAEAVARASRSWPAPPAAHICTPEEAASVWYVRESALGAVVFVPGEPDAWEGWEDAAVPPEQLGNYLRSITTLMAEYGYRSPLYGHYGQGCVHTRINFDFRTDDGIRKFRHFLERAADVVLRYGGSFSGEHGDGQARASLLPKMFGPELMQAFREFKALWDPDNRMNPGKLVDAVRVYDPAENLRPQYKPAGAPGLDFETGETHFAFSKESGSFERAAERCVGVGACRKQSGGVMCPSYRATGEELHSTRGRARLLWEMLSGDLRPEGFQSEIVNEALSLCLSCKACKTECPVQVDMAQYKAEFLAQRYKGRRHPLHHYIFGFADKLARWGSLAPVLTNAILNGPLTSPIIKRIAGISPERRLPAFAPQPFHRLRGPRPTLTAKRREAQSPPPEVAPQVVLWPDTWNNYYHPQSLAAAELLLSQAGFEVKTPEGHICCGRALYDFGLLDQARQYLSDVLTRMAPQIDTGLPFLFLEPSCASVFRDELPELFPHDPRAVKLRDSVWLLADFLAAKAPNLAAGRLQGAKILVHGHCHHKAVFGGPKSEIALLRLAGATVDLIQAGCCGMAGPFGFEAEKFEVSKTIANLDLLPAVTAAPAETLIVADGFSCREQIDQLGHRTAIHFAEALAFPPCPPD